MKLEPYYQDPSTLHIGTEETRPYYIPERTDGINPFISLNGAWSFHYYENPYLVEENFFMPEFSEPGFCTVSVPGCWQNYGADCHQYTNVRYPFPYDPPFVPDENPCGAYRTTFYLSKEEAAQQLYLNFEGVDSCFYLWINGKPAGYSQVSHSTSEFNISSYVHSGTNQLSVLVLKWCDGCYLEDQDKFRMSGIFRDVYLLIRPTGHLWSYFVHTELTPNHAKAVIRTDLTWKGSSCTAIASIFDPDGNLLGTGHTDGATSHILQFEVENPVLWNAEAPRLYHLVLEANGEKIHQEIGIRSIKVNGRIMTVNDVEIKFKGVNRHDSDPVTGFTISKEQAITDLKLMKEHNINAIRTSHYPNAPWFPKLCNQYGFYLIGEADIESHSCTSIYNGGHDTFSLIAEDPMFAPAILDRVKRNVIRDQNNPCIIMWSLGNESGYGENFVEAGHFVKQYDPDRLLQYESSIYHLPGKTPDTSVLDVYSKMYDSLEMIDEYFENPDNQKPYVLCEFIHAMGNGPGDIEDYFKKIYSTPGFTGGFVWEWCDHAIDMGKTIEGKKVYYYGGDFGEFPHDGNFCMDGLVYPNRKPHTGLLEYKNVIRPARITYDNGIFTIHNMLDFTNLTEAISISYEITDGKNILNAGCVNTPDTKPHEASVLEVTDPLLEEYDATSPLYIRFLYAVLQKTDLLEKNHPCGFDQICLKEASPEPIPLPKQTDVITIQEDGKYICLSNCHFHYTFNKFTGLFDTLVQNNRQVLAKPQQWNIWRAPMDNDKNAADTWKSAGYDRSTVKVYQALVEQTEKAVMIHCSLSLAAQFIQHIADIRETFTIYEDGSIQVNIHAARNTELPFLPRFGLRLFLPKTYSQTEYTGYGPYESYIDKHHASWYGTFQAPVSALHEDYIKPQENGSHYGTTSLALTGNNQDFVHISSYQPFSFNASYYTQEELGEKMHNFDLKPCDFTVLCIDYKMSGCGSNSCGPELAHAYRLQEENINFNFMIRFN